MESDLAFKKEDLSIYLLNSYAPHPEISPGKVASFSSPASSPPVAVPTSLSSSSPPSSSSSSSPNDKADPLGVSTEDINNDLTIISVDDVRQVKSPSEGNPSNVYQMTEVKLKICSVSKCLRVCACIMHNSKKYVGKSVEFTTHNNGKQKARSEAKKRKLERKQKKALDKVQPPRINLRDARVLLAGEEVSEDNASLDSSRSSSSCSTSSDSDRNSATFVLKNSAPFIEESAGPSFLSCTNSGISNIGEYNRNIPENLTTFGSYQHQYQSNISKTNTNGIYQSQNYSNNAWERSNTVYGQNSDPFRANGYDGREREVHVTDFSRQNQARGNFPPHKGDMHPNRPYSIKGELLNGKKI